VKGSHRSIPRGFLTILVVMVVPLNCLGTQRQQIENETVIGDGWHPWYEIKADQENPENLIVCGTKWDARLNAAFGFVYASSDGGKAWQSVLEDRNSTWVTEQSCAFGSNHRAYFISEASKVIDGNPHHELGSTRLYVSTDGGQHWRETAKTGWADWSTAEVSLVSGRLYTFFNAYTTGEAGRNWGSNIGLLVFSPDGKEIAGPFFDSGIQSLSYQGTFPSDAVAVRSGAVVALYYGMRQTSAGMEADLGIIHADQSSKPSMNSTLLSIANGGKHCFNLGQGSLAYDRERNRLFVVYVDGCKETRIMLTSSEDEGRTWTKSVAIAISQLADRRVGNPSLVVGSDGALGLLCEEGQGSGRWFFFHIRDQKLVEQLTELSSGPENEKVSDDSLLTWIDQSSAHQGDNSNAPSAASIALSIHNERNSVWRGSGLITTGGKIVAVWPSGGRDGMGLYSAVLSPAVSASNDKAFPAAKDASDSDVTRQSVILYGGTQHFDSTTGTLEVCLVLANRGPKAIEVPIRVLAEDIRSPAGAVSIVDSTNGLTGVGAVWDISQAVTGDQIPPRANSNSFCLSFHIESAAKSILPIAGDNLLFLRMRVLASGGTLSEREKRSKGSLK